VEIHEAAKAAAHEFASRPPDDVADEERCAS
jgi:hypothetical protein